MEIIINVSRGIKPETIEILTYFTHVFASALNLHTSKYVLQLYCIPNLNRDYGHKGAVAVTGKREISAMIDSKLLRSLPTLAPVLAHEMVHVKQFARGQLVQKIRPGKSPQFIWRGKPCKKKYYDRPWELEAFGRQQLLANLIAD